MNLLTEVVLLWRVLRIWCILWLILSVVLFSFGISPKAVTKIRADLLPANVRIIVSEPAEAITAQLGISLFLSFIATLPFLLWQILTYVSPALYPNERRMLGALILLSFPLVLLGMVFGYVFLLPTTIRVLYGYASTVGAEPLLSIGTLMSFVAAALLMSGILFLLPLLMLLTSISNLVPPTSWKAKWRHVITLSLLFAAVITPDASGITMGLLMIPLVGLYLFGLLLSFAVQRRSR